jgi:BirA family biotin operon repressor/biotin-[acetyl-CoA-carboxylase] ligase
MYQKLFIGNKVITLDEVDSTNIFLQQLISGNKKEVEGLVVIAKNQSYGKGRGSNLWQSEKDKNLTFSILLHPNVLVQNQFQISKVISLGIVDLLSNLGLDNVKIKWPNDIYIEDKKISGILIENAIRSNKIYHSIVGIGLNVKQTSFEPMINNPTSIYNETGSKLLSLNELLDMLLFFIEKRYLLLKTNKLKIIDEDYIQHLYRLNEIKKFLIDDKEVVGTIIGISPIGKLQLKDKNKINEYDLNQVKFL